MGRASKVALDIILRAKDEASKILDQAQGSLGGLGNIAKKAATGGLAIAGSALLGLSAAGIGAGVAIGDMAMQAAPLEGISATFESLTGNAEGMLDALQTGSRNMVSDAELMKQYNSAAISVNETFANELPQALDYFGKISAATGEDVGYLMDSYVLGISRLSPMILDNLKIQVNQTAANEAYAATIGKTVDELSKEEQQAALNAQVLELLAEKTASMPDVTNNAAVSMAQLQTTLQNAKDQIGTAFLPAINALLIPLADLAVQYGPQVVAWAEVAGQWLGEKIPEAVAWAVQAFNDVKAWLQGPGPEALATIQAVWNEKFGWINDWVRENMPLIRETITTVMEKIQTVIGVILGWVRDFWERHGLEISQIAQAAWNVIWTIIDTYLKNIFDVAKFWMQIITGDWDGAMETLRGIGERTWEAIKTIFKDGIFMAKNWISIGMDEILTLLSNLWGSMRDAGGNLIDGMIQGIRDAAGRLVDAASNVVGNALEAARNLLGIHSPSQAFAEIGQYAMEGLALGLNQYSAAPQMAMRGQMAALTGSAAGGLAASGGMASGGITIINQFGPGSVRDDQDIEEIARRQEEILLLRGVRTFGV